MATQTENMNLIKPDITDFYAIGEFNSNMDIIDGCLRNPNILDNGWFQINQRGQTIYNGGDGVYCVDRWKLPTSGNNAEVLSDGLGLTKTNSTVGKMIEQKFENEYPIGTYTISVVLSNSAFNNISLVLTDSSGSNDGVANITVPLPNTKKLFTATVTTTKPTNGFYIALANGGTITIHCVKVERGSVSTFLNDLAPDYQTELLKCQRYFQKMWMIDASLYQLSANRIAFGKQYNIPMRTTPSASITEVGGGIRVDNTYPSGFSITVSPYPKGADVFFDKTNHGYNVSHVFNANVVIDLSADL